MTNETLLLIFQKILTNFDKRVESQFRLDGSTQNFMIKTSVIVKNRLDLIFEGLQRHLKKQMKWPYYFTRKKMVFYDQEDSAWFKINGSDISAFIDVI